MAYAGKYRPVHSTANAAPSKQSTSGTASPNGHLTSKVQFSGATGGSPAAKKGGGQSGPLTSVDPNYTPPPCWYEPMYDPDEVKAMYKTLEKNAVLYPYAPYKNWVPKSQADLYNKLYGKDGKYKGFKNTKKGQGKFWAGVVNPKMKDDPAAYDCNKPPFWVPKGKTPTDVPQAVNPRILAEAAWGAIDIPGVKLKMNPQARSTVNLSTWVWSDRAAIKPLSVTASLPELGLSATTTATPSQMKLDPGTSDAQMFPASGVCPADKGGRIGAEYHKGAKGNPPCGITYQHASNNGPFALRATITWTVKWTGSNGDGGTLTPGTFGSEQDREVQEVQSVVSQ